MYLLAEADGNLNHRPGSVMESNMGECMVRKSLRATSRKLDCEFEYLSGILLSIISVAY